MRLLLRADFRPLGAASTLSKPPLAYKLSARCRAEKSALVRIFQRELNAKGCARRIHPGTVNERAARNGAERPFKPRRKLNFPLACHQPTRPIDALKIYQNQTRPARSFATVNARSRFRLSTKFEWEAPARIGLASPRRRRRDLKAVGRRRVLTGVTTGCSIAPAETKVPKSRGPAQAPIREGAGGERPLRRVVPAKATPSTWQHQHTTFDVCAHGPPQAMTRLRRASPVNGLSSARAGDRPSAPIAQTLTIEHLGFLSSDLAQAEGAAKRERFITRSEAAPGQMETPGPVPKAWAFSTQACRSSMFDRLGEIVHGGYCPRGADRGAAL